MSKKLEDVQDVNIIKELYTNPDIPAVEVARQLNCHPTTLYKVAKRLNLNCKRSNKKKLDIELIEKLFVEQQMSPEKISSKLGCSASTVTQRLKEVGINSRSRNEAHKLWHAQKRALKGNRRLNSAGYVVVFKPGHPRADANNEVREHILVWEEHHKKLLPEGWHVHHLNGIKTDNRPANLVALPLVRHRAKYTNLLDERAKRVRELEIENRQLRQALENSQMIFYLSEN